MGKYEEWKDPKKSKWPRPEGGWFRGLRACGNLGLSVVIYTMREFAQKIPKMPPPGLLVLRFAAE